MEKEPTITKEAPTDAKILEMSKLKQRLQDIDKKEDYPEEEAQSRRTLFYDDSKSELFVRETRGDKRMTFGDIIADYDWGIKYRPDASVPDKIWRKIRKLSDVNEARTNIEQVFNQEIVYKERISLPTTSLPIEFLEEKLDNQGVQGVVAERMAKNFLTRVQYNNPNLKFTVESSNAIEDAELKYDFKIATEQRKRGIAIEGDKIPRDELVSAKRRVGIQFTTTADRKLIRKKKRQISDVQSGLEQLKLKYQHLIKRPVDDVVLVALHLDTYRKRFKKWLDNGKPSGGPEQYLDHGEKMQLVEKTTNNFLTLSKHEIRDLKF